MPTGLSPADYLILVAYLAACLAFGYAFSRGNEDTEEYLMAGRAVPAWAAGVSYVVSLLSTVSMVAVPGEAYNYGIALSFRNVVEPAFALLSFYLFVRFYFRKRVFTPFVYLEERFDRRVRALGSLIFFFTRTIYLALVLFSSAKVFEGAAGWSPPVTILLIGIVGIVYVLTGGMRAVVWTDVMQFVVLFGGLASVLLICTLQVDGGLAGIWRTAVDSGRGFNFEDPDLYRLDPFTRVSIWYMTAAVLLEYLFYNSADQISIQRLLSTGSYKQAERSIWVVAVATLPIMGLLWILGLAVYAFYAQSGTAAELQGDTALFRFVATQLPPLLPGLFLAAMLAAIMSTLHTGLHSLATVAVKDFYVVFVRPASDESIQVRFSRYMILALGVLSIGLAIAIAGISQQSQSTFIEIAVIAMAYQGVLAPIFLIGVTSRRVGTTDILRAVVVSWLVTTAMIVWYLRSAGTAQPVSFLFVPFPGLLAMLVIGYLPALWRPPLPAARIDGLTLRGETAHSG